MKVPFFKKRFDDFDVLPEDDKIATLEKNGKLLIYLVLTLVLLVVAIGTWNDILYVVLLCAGMLIENAVKIWGVKTYRGRIVCYVFDSVFLLGLTYFVNGQFISTIYMLIFSEFYLSQKKLVGCLIMFLCELAVFITVTVLSGFLHDPNVELLGLISGVVVDITLLSLHFLIFNFGVQLYRKDRRANKAMSELKETNLKLRKTYAELQEAVVYEERQRIAKDIHDSTGHSITTVIMQTEAAKLKIDTDPEEAKRMIASANIQAKLALESLRDSVHLFSGVGKRETLKQELLAVLNDTSDGTDIAIRSEVEDVPVSDEVRRFLVNTLKEGLSNGMRHGKATAFYFEWRRDGNDGYFYLSDNGVGVEKTKLCEGFGLGGMRERAERFGGTIEFESSVDDGFEITIRIPLEK